MKQPFQHPVSYKSKKLLLQAELQRSGFGRPVIIEVEDKPVRSKRAEENRYRLIFQVGRAVVNAMLVACIIRMLELICK